MECNVAESTLHLPRDEVRGAFLKWTAMLSSHPKLTFKVAADSDRSWQLEVMAGN
jgi:hypothetical protein